jgi:hypothetical protein
MRLRQAVFITQIEVGGHSNKKSDTSLLFLVTCRFTVAEWLKMTDSRPIFGGISEVYFSNRYSLWRGWT